MPEIILTIGFVLVCAGAYLTYEVGVALIIAGAYLTVVAVLMAYNRN